VYKAGTQLLYTLCKHISYDCYTNMAWFHTTASICIQTVFTKIVRKASKY